MKIAYRTTLCGASILALSSCTTKQSRDKNAPVGPPSATLTFKGKSAAYWLSGGGGDGTLVYNGESHRFSARVVGLGGSGAHSLSSVGKVYNLSSLADFPGTYEGLRSGLTLFRGKQYAKLTNDKGVIIYVESKTSGLASSSGIIRVAVDFN